jgi:hypothetical protein
LLAADYQSIYCFELAMPIP